MRFGFWLALTGAIIGGTQSLAAIPAMEMQEIDKSLAIGYGVVLHDINGDGKPDIVVADKARVIWFENPTWKMRVILGNKTQLDNVCIAAADIDGDGNPDLALGAGWKPSTTEPSTLQWLKQPADLEKEWEMFPIKYDEPTLHRIRFADLDGDGKPELITAPLHGKGATGGKNFSEAGPSFSYYKIPADPVKGPWEPLLIDGSKHVMHNFLPIDLFDKKQMGILTASYEGIFYQQRLGDSKWLAAQLGEGNQADPAKSRGAGEVRVGKSKTGDSKFIATIEPFHGNQVVVYTTGPDPKVSLMTRTVIDDQLKSGHALACADLDGDGTDEIIMGFRDPFSGTIKFGINVYRRSITDGKTKWEKNILDDGGMATEDLAVADLNGDGKPDIVAVGRASKNVRIYWNKSK